MPRPLPNNLRRMIPRAGAHMALARDSDPSTRRDYHVYRCGYLKGWIVRCLVSQGFDYDDAVTRVSQRIRAAADVFEEDVWMT